MQVTFDSKHIILIVAIFFLLLGAGVYFFSNRPSDSRASNTPTQANSIQTNSRSQSSSPKPEPKTEEIRYEANRTGWMPIGSGSMVLEVKGQIKIGRSVEGDVIVGPEGWIKLGDLTALVAGLPFGSLVARVGDGQPFLVGSYKKIDAGSQTVYIAINDSTYGEGAIKSETTNQETA